MRYSKVLSTALLVAALLAVTILPGMAGSTTKSLSSNFTLVNLGTGPATGLLDFIKPDGSPWKASVNFSIPTAYGQAAFKQYFDGDLPPGQGSVVVSSDQPLGAVVQLQARPPQVPTMGAYNGIEQGSGTVNVPLVIRNLVGASGLANSQVIVQNTGASDTSVNIKLVGAKPDGTDYVKSYPALKAGASVLYDLADDSAANVKDAYAGSAVVTAGAGGSVGVVSSLFTGPNGMQVFNGFSTPARTWLVPQFSSRLLNGLSTPIAIQNLSGADIPVNGITVSCKKNPNSAGTGDTLTIMNPAVVHASASFNVNPVNNNPVPMPDNWYGACTISSPNADVVAFVQMRVIGTDNAAAYEALKGDTTDKKVVIPLAARHMANGFATVTDLMNVSATNDAHVTVTYIPSPDYVAGGGSAQNVVINGIVVPAGSMVQQNLRFNAVTQLPDGWYGSSLIESSDQPINAILEMTVVGAGAGDTYQAHNAFTQP